MLDLTRQVEITDTNNSEYESRTTYVSNAWIREYECKNTGYQSLGVAMHNSQLDTISMRTKTISGSDGKKFKVKTISFLDGDGVEQAIKIFGQHY